ncbi:MAG: helix-turn-helix domain-containing protein [Alphaproteobacteria bacterium]|nr:helix-turn-helix domain-containing protein [Alphaproteobacteria bacterium]
MPALVIRSDIGSEELRRRARRRISARLIAIANALEGMDRASAARLAGMARQTLRDWVHRYNREGIAGLCNRPAPGKPSKKILWATDGRAPVGFGVQHPTQETAHGDLVQHPAGRRRRVCYDVCRFGTEQVELAGGPAFAGCRQGQPASVCR